MKTNMLEQEKKSIRKECGKLAWGILWYECMLFLSMMAGLIVEFTQTAISHGGDVLDEDLGVMAASMTQSGTSYLVAIALGLPFLYLFFRKVPKEHFFKMRNPMTLEVFIMAIAAMLSCQMVFGLVYGGTESALNHFGLTIMGDTASAAESSTTISMFLYASIVGPISEELIFRGFILRTLEKHGKLFAICISSILFGIYHGNLIQGVFAVGGGLIFGYIAMEYSIWWSILLHLINNCLFSDVLLYVIKGFSEQTQNVILYGIQGGAVILTVVLFTKNRKRIAAYLKENKVEGYRYAFASVGMVLFCICGIILGVLGIQRI